MTSRLFGGLTKKFARAVALWCGFLICCSVAVCAQQATVNPVGKWTPVVSEFHIPEARARSGGSIGPPFTRVESREPKMLSAWEALKDTVKIKRRRLYEDEPVIGGWRPWADPKTPEVSGIEVKRSDKIPGDAAPCLPVMAVERGGDIPLRWKIDIWGRYRLPERPKLLPADAEFQRLIKQKIQVTDFSLAVYKLEGELSWKNVRNAASPEPFKIIGQYRSGLHSSLAFYESQEYRLPATADYVGEIRLEVKLRFPEAERQAETAYEVPVEACLRFICGSRFSIRVISDEIRHVE